MLLFQMVLIIEHLEKFYRNFQKTKAIVSSVAISTYTREKQSLRLRETVVVEYHSTAQDNIDTLNIPKIIAWVLDKK